MLSNLLTNYFVLTVYLIVMYYSCILIVCYL